MIRVLGPQRGMVRRLGFAAAALFALSVVASKHAEAMSLINAGAAPAAKQVSQDITTPVHGGGRGGHGGGGHFGGGGGRHFGGGGHGGTHFPGGAYHFAPAMHGGGHHFGGYHYGGGYRFAHHHRHFYRPYYYGSYAPSYYYPYRRCRVIWTDYGPRRVCHHRHWHHRHHWRHHRHYW